jgi:uncharacterized protein involved in exopolysaccharide biosynthesis
LATDVQHTTASSRVDVLPALRRHWFVALLAVLVFVAGAVMLGLKRPVKYQTTANLSVGHVYVNNPVGIPTVIEATQSLAGVYSRAIDSSEVRAATGRRLARQHGRVAGNLSATPIPQSPLIKVSAESSSRRGAVALANAGSAELATYVNRQIRDNDAATLIAGRYRTAALRYRQARERRGRAQLRYERLQTRERKAARDRTAAAAETALLRRAALRVSYEAAVQGGTSSIGVEVFSRASPPTMDRWSVMQLLVFVGLVGGLATGTALAVLLTAREFRRYSHG